MTLACLLILLKLSKELLSAPSVELTATLTDFPEFVDFAVKASALGCVFTEDWTGASATLLELSSFLACGSGLPICTGDG